jgi:subtilisin family serine protease
MVAISCLLSLPGNELEKSNDFHTGTPQEVNVLIKFKPGLFSSSHYVHNVEQINSLPIRTIFEQNCLVSIRSIFGNRYDSLGRLKGSLAKSNFHFLEGWQEVKLPSRELANRFIAAIESQPEVEQAQIEEPIFLKPALEPNDPEYLADRQWHLNNPWNTLSDIDAETAWDINRGRNDVVVAILDSGVDYLHPDLDPGNRTRIIAGRDTGEEDNDPMDDLANDSEDSFAGHGTSVA